VRVMHARQHRHLIVYHRLVALDTLLQDDLDGALALRPVGLAHDAIGAGAECAAKVILGPETLISRRLERGFGNPVVLLLVAIRLSAELMHHGGDYCGV
jgi:hypothetical protein